MTAPNRTTPTDGSEAIHEVTAPGRCVTAHATTTVESRTNDPAQTTADDEGHPVEHPAHGQST